MSHLFFNKHVTEIYVKMHVDNWQQYALKVIPVPTFIILEYGIFSIASLCILCGFNEYCLTQG